MFDEPSAESTAQTTEEPFRESAKGRNGDADRESTRQRRRQGGATPKRVSQHR
jgi:hypothetical protein